METLTPLVQAFLSLGPTVILPVFIFFIGLGFGLGPAKSFRSGLTIGVGFVGILLSYVPLSISILVMTPLPCYVLKMGHKSRLVRSLSGSWRSLQARSRV